VGRATAVVALLLLLVSCRAREKNAQWWEQPAPCQGQYWPISKGAEWVYDSTSGPIDEPPFRQPRIVTILRVEPHRVVVESKTGLGESTVTTYVCTYTGAQRVVTPDDVPLPAKDVTVELKGIRFAWSPNVGFRWESVEETRENRFGGDTRTLAVLYTVERYETIEVPAGNFAAHKVVVTSTFKTTAKDAATTPEVSGTEWYAPKVGLVRSEIVRADRPDDPHAIKTVEELVSFTPGK
jgi:hypothetical protein